MEPPNLASPPVLPKHSDLSASQISFLNQHFSTQNDLHKAPDILRKLNDNCSDLDANLLTLQKGLTKRIVSWISTSFKAKTALANLNIKLENLSLFISHYGIGSKRVRQVLDTELPRLVKELQRIESIRKYVDTTLQLEALVGDLEDAVFSGVDRRTGKMFSGKLSSIRVSMDSGLKEERLNQAIKAMKGIEEVLVGVAKFRPQWHHLLESVDMRVDKTLAVLRPQVLADHRALLASLGWPPKLSMSKFESGDISSIPNPLLLMQGDRRKSYSQSFLALCALQHLQTQREERRHNLLGQKECVLQLWAIDELASPIASRMEYHFMKWIEQPEFIFALVYKITRDFIIGVDDVLQPLIDRARLLSCSAKEAWVYAMVQMLSGFLGKRIFSALAERYKQKDEKLEVVSSWLHLIDLIVAYDKRMQSLVTSETGFLMGESERFERFSRGITVLTMFCDRPDWLKIWAKIELKDAWKKLKAELKEERSWLIGGKCGVNLSIDTDSEQYLLSSRESYKAPLIAETALKISWEVIERCQSLPAVLSRVQFIRSTAGTFLWHFFNVLIFRCKNAFLCDNLDNDALAKICRSINAARYVEFKLGEWSDDATFLEMRIVENDSRICRKDDVDDDSAFFSEEINSLAELETNWLMEIIAVVLRQFESLSWEYFQRKELFEQEQEHSQQGALDIMDSTVSVDFVEALDTLRDQLQVFKMNLNSKDFMDLWRSVADGLDHYISSSILTSDIKFIDQGANQFRVDMQALFMVFQPFCARPEAFFPLVREILKLLKISEAEVKHLRVVLSKDGNGIKCLQNSCGISHLSFHQVDKVLRNRSFRF